MKIWWCQEHEGSGNEHWCWVSPFDRRQSCRMVPMRLIPDDALEQIGNGVLVALLESGLDINGKWSKTKNVTFAETILAALDGETP